MAVPVCAVCGGSHGDRALCPGARKKEGNTVPSTLEADSVTTERTSAPAFLVGPGTRLGAFELLEEIGRGRMGRVFRALDTALQREVAIKIISPGFLLGNQQATQRFLAEARLTARIRHENVVQVRSLETDADGNPFLVMELLEGRTLDAALLTHEPFPTSRIVSIGTQVLAALTAAHAHLVHRDLKPEDIFLTPDPDGDDRVVVLDFGVAKSLNDAGAGLTGKQTLVLETPAYTAPEILLGIGSRDDPRQDLYALGVVLFVLTTGRFPWTDADMEDLPEALLEGRRPMHLADVAPDADPSYAEVVDRALAVDPAERWQSATDFSAALRSLDAFLPGTLVGKTYRIERQLGRGGMSIVYLAKDVRMERACAVKALLVTDEEDPGGVVRERFRRDGALAVASRHPNVVEVYVQGVWRGRPYIITEFVDGKTLRELLGTLDWPSLVALVRQIAAAVDAVHEAGIVHRDVKPENILVDARGVAKLVDFGFARRTASELTAAGVGLGSFGYMAPEQAADPTTAAAASDEWSLAAIVYEALTGQKPFYSRRDGASALEPYLDRLLNLAAPEEPAKMNPTVSPALSEVVLRALSQDASARFETCAAFAEALVAAPSVGVRLMNRIGGPPIHAGQVLGDSLSAALVVETPQQGPGTRRVAHWRTGAVAVALVGFAGTAVGMWLRSPGRPSASEVPPPVHAVASTASSPRKTVALPDAALDRRALTPAPDAHPLSDEGISVSPSPAVQGPAAQPAPKRLPAPKRHDPVETAPRPAKKPDPAVDKDGVLRI